MFLRCSPSTHYKGGFKLGTAGRLGERKVIETILMSLDQMPGMPIPFGDDISAVEIDDEKLAALKTDMLIGKTDVPPGMSVKQAARKAVIMNISDFAAKGVKPRALLASIAIPREFTKENIQEIAEGLNIGAREYQTYVLGGDTNEASDLVISCTAFGIVEKNRLMTRYGARPGDFVGVTGTFGKPSSGLKILMEAFEAPSELSEALVNAVLMPKARLKAGLALSQTGVVTASIDSSDGLAWSLHEISRASNIGFTIDSLPIAREVDEFASIHNLDPVE